MTDNLRLLDLAAANRITEEFRTSDATIDVDDFVRDFGRPVDLTPLRTVIEKAMKDEGFKDDGDRPASDAWLSPRVHAALRLTRREGADRRLWAWLAVVAFPQYVRWRFRRVDTTGAATGTAEKRFVGAMHRDHAIARLWWGAELTRDGSDYTPTVAAFKKQDVPNTWFSLKAFEHRPTALAACRVLPSLSSDDINRLARSFDHVLTTIVLDSVAPSPAPDGDAIDEWIHGEPEDGDLAKMPLGPNEDRVPEESIKAAERFLESVAERTGVSTGRDAGTLASG